MEIQGGRQDPRYVALAVPPRSENIYCHGCRATRNHLVMLVRYPDGRRKTYYDCPLCGRQQESR